MNTPTSKNNIMKILKLSGKVLFSFSVVMLFFTACKKEKEKLYDVNQIKLLPSGSGKAKLKTNEQYIAILYTNLFQKALSANQIFDISRTMESIGDQELAREVVISNFLNKQGVILPSHKEMWDDTDEFIIDTFNRFYVRNPTEAEKTYLKDYIQQNSDPADSSRVSPEIVYFSFALSNEYMYY